MGNTPKLKKKSSAPSKKTTAVGRSRPPQWLKYALGGIGAVAFIAVIALISRDVTENPQGIPDPPPGVETFVISDVGHTELPVDYPTDPPVGGVHDATPLECRVYDTPVPNENALHALEHGAVWISYQPELAADDVDRLEGHARRSRELIVSPYPGIADPIVLTAWGVQLRLDSATDERIDTFIRAYENQVAPENAAGC